MEKHFDEFSNLFERLNHSFDIIGVSETRLSSSSAGNTSLPGYSFLGVSSESIAGGVGLYISAKITFKPRTDLSKILYSSTNLESIFIELIFKGKKKHNRWMSTNIHLLTLMILHILSLSLSFQIKQRRKIYCVAW